MPVMSIIEERAELYQELIDMAEANDYDLDEINTITEEISDLDDQIQKENIALVPSLIKLI